MAVKTNTTLAANIQVAAREIDFVSRFQDNWEALREIMGIMRPIRKAPGTVLKVKTASITLQSGAVAEGDEVPYSLAAVTEQNIGTITIEKYAKATSAEAIIEDGYDNAIAKTDAAFLSELQSGVMNKFYTFLLTGSLTATYSTFQMAIAMARGAVLNKFKGMHKGVSEVVGFVNIMDFYGYLGAADITVQTQFGLTYVQNFMGYRVVFLCADGESNVGNAEIRDIIRKEAYRFGIIDRNVKPDAGKCDLQGMQGLDLLSAHVTCVGAYTHNNYKLFCAFCQYF